MPRGHRPPDGFDDRGDFRRRCAEAAKLSRRARAYFDDDREPLLAGRLQRERGAAARLKVWVARLDRGLDVLRIVVEAANDDEVFQPPGDEQLSVPQKT